ncbi:MAG: hypothetical protein RBU45_24350 [Myxococcota bacterium]|jgi:hypothetical protein|nr:hypothetical protein [Myxococcota bacterium]
MIGDILLWGLVVGLAHFVVLGALYQNPFVARLYAEAAGKEPGLRVWASQPRYMLAMFLGTQVEVYALTAAYLGLRPYVPLTGWPEALALGGVFAVLRVYPRFWNMWIQSTYPGRLLAVEAVNGCLGTVFIVLGVQLLA